MKNFFHNKIVLIKMFFWAIMSSVLTWPLLTKGDSIWGTSGKLENPLSVKSFAELIEKIADIVFKVGFPIAVIFLLYSGFLFVSAQGNETKIKTAKNTFWWAIVGTAVLLGAKVIASAIRATIESWS